MSFGFGMDPFIDFPLCEFGSTFPSTRTLTFGPSRSIFPSTTTTALAPLDDRRLLNFERLSSNPLPVDIEDRENEYLVRVHQRETGMRKKELRVDVENGMLTIRGEGERESGDVTSGNYSQRYRSVTRSMVLPENIDENKIEARYEDNHLIIHLPKTSTTRGRRTIQIGGMKRGAEAGAGAGAGAGAEQAEQKQAEYKQTEKQTEKQAHTMMQGQAQAQAQAHHACATCEQHHAHGHGQGQGHA